MKDYEFIIVSPADEESIMNFHKSLAQGLIDKHGVEVMKQVLELLEIDQN